MNKTTGYIVSIIIAIITYQVCKVVPDWQFTIAYLGGCIDTSIYSNLAKNKYT